MTFLLLKVLSFWVVKVFMRCKLDALPLAHGPLIYYSIMLFFFRGFSAVYTVLTVA